MYNIFIMMDILPIKLLAEKLKMEGQVGFEPTSHNYNINVCELPIILPTQCGNYFYSKDNSIVYNSISQDGIILIDRSYKLNTRYCEIVLISFTFMSVSNELSNFNPAIIIALFGFR